MTSTLGTASSRSLSNTSQMASGHVRQAKVPVRHTHTQSVAQVRFDSKVPSLQEIKCDPNIQVQVDQCLRELTDISQTGISNKVKSQRARLRFWFETESSGPMSLSWPVLLKNIFHTTSLL